MSISVRTLLSIASLCGAMFSAADALAAYPDRTVHLMVGFPPGGGPDVTARLIAGKLSEKWGQPVVVENKEGADGTISEDVVAHATPDGYTIAIITPTHTVTASQRKLNYDPLKAFAPISFLNKLPDVLVVDANSSVKTLGDLVALAKSKPGQLNFGSGGSGTPDFLEMELLKKFTGMNMVSVTYRGASAAIPALLGGEIQAMFQPISTVLDQIKAGKLRALAITTERRFTLVPDVPTFNEVLHVKDFDEEGHWFGALAPAGTSKEIVAKLHDDMVASMQAPDVKDKFAAAGFLLVGSSPQEFDEFLKTDIARWADLLKSVGAK